jgi:recombination protein RecA
MFGNPEVTPGGRALKFYSSVRLDIRRIETLKEGNEAVGNRARVRIVKNKVAPPFKEAEFDIMYGQGISTEGDILDLAVQANIIQKSGAWFSYGDQRLGQGRENVRQFLHDNPELVQQLRTEVIAAVEADWGVTTDEQAEEAKTGEAVSEGTQDEDKKSSGKTGEADPE